MENKQNIKDLIQKFYPHAKEKLGFDHPVRVIMRQDAENAQQSLGKTAYYDPAEKLIVLYVTDRHPKDVLRSFSHELVHHAQNCRGELDDLTTGGHYAKDGKGREIEEEAYLQGNLNLRDYEDSIKFEGVNEMKLTKSQLKGLIEQTIEKITEKKLMDEQSSPDNPFLTLANGLETKVAELRVAAKEGDAGKTVGAIQGLKRTLSMFEKDMETSDDGRIRFTGGAYGRQPTGELKEKKFPDLTGDGKVTQADILKGRGVKLKEKEHENDSALDDDGFDAFRDAFKSVTGGEEGDSEKEKNRERFRAVARAAERTKEKREEGGEMDEQEMVVKADVTIPDEGKRILDLFDNFLAKSDVEEAETKAFVAAIIEKADEAGVDVASPDNGIEMDEMHCGGKRDDELEEQEMKPTIKGKKIDIKKEPKDSKDPVVKVATDKRKKVAEPSLDVKENNETWYNSSLYESLKSKWTK